MKKILIIGATSAMAIAYARLNANKQTSFYLVARNSEKLAQVSQDLLAQGAAGAHTFSLDVNDIETQQLMIDDCFSKMSSVEIALIAHGTLPNQEKCQLDYRHALAEFNTNATSTLSLLTILANKFETQHFGTIAVITSVAGDRGRPSNYLYGSAKAAVSSFCEGLRARLFKAGVHLLDIRPGFVDTPMTQDLVLPQILVVTPEYIAKSIDSAIKRRTDVLYTPWFWFWILLIIRQIPRSIFKRLKL